jgi:hypothetical protein
LHTETLSSGTLADCWIRDGGIIQENTVGGTHRDGWCDRSRVWSRGRINMGDESVQRIEVRSQDNQR